MIVKQAAAKWGVSPECVRRWIRTGRLAATKTCGYEIADDAKRPARLMPGPKKGAK